MDFNATFRYPPLLQSTDSIRLLRTPSVLNPNEDLKFTLETFSLHSAPVYCALSYCWGSPFPLDGEEYASEGPDTDWTTLTQTIYCNGLPYHIAQNLYDALLTVSHKYKPSYLWVDYICISQGSLAEKGAQIMLMGHIFSAAETVLCWLGRGDECSYRAIECMKMVWETLGALESDVDYASNAYWSDLELDLECEQAQSTMMKASGGRFPISSPPPSLLHWNDVSCFCRRRYFRRLWVVQEYGLAKAPTFLCGTETFTAEILQSTIDYMVVSASGSALMSRYNLNTGPADWVLHLTSASLRRWQPDQFRQLLVSKANITEESQVPYAILAYVLALTSSFESSDARDKVYALLGLAQLYTQPPGHLTIRAQYDIEVTDLLYEVAVTLIREIPVLVCLSLINDQVSRKTQGLPSWVPTLDTAVEPQANTSRLALGLSAGINRPACRADLRVIDGTRLTLEGTFVDEILKCGLKVSWHPDHVSKLFLNDTINLIQEMPLRYKPTRQDRLEVLWRTLIYDFDDLAGMRATASTGECFPDWLSKSLIGAHPEDEISWKEADTKSLAHNLLELIRTSIHSDHWLSQSSLKDLHLGHDKLRDPSRQRDFLLKADSFLRMSFALMKLMRTSKNYLGLCLPSAEPGDQVWIIRDARAPSILRPLSEPGTYEFIGDAYLHGFSHGEIFEHNPKFEKVTLM